MVKGVGIQTISLDLNGKPSKGNKHLTCDPWPGPAKIWELRLVGRGREKAEKDGLDPY